MIKKSKDVRSELTALRESDNNRGVVTGFRSLNELYTIKYGSFTCILAAPHHGKSELAFEIAINQAVKYGIKSLICSPETGSVADIYSELIHKLSGKRLVKGQHDSIDDAEYYKWEAYIDEMFNIVDSEEKSYSFKNLFDLAGEDDRLIIADPYNEFEHDMSSFGTRQDLYIESLMGEVRRFCKKTNRHMIMTLHPSSQKQILDDKTKKYYYGMPNAREAAGGQALFRKAMTWINMWRPPTFLNDEHGQPFDDNVVYINVEKAKPKFVSYKGTIKMYFDWKRSRYYEKINNRNLYAFDYEKHGDPQQWGMVFPESSNTSIF